MTPALNSIAAPVAIKPAAPAPAASAPAQEAGHPRAEAKVPDIAPKAVPVAVPKKTSVNLEEGIKKMQEIVDRMNQEMQAQKRGLSFSYDNAINTHVVTVKSATSGEVIRQIPTEVVVRVAHSLEKLKGLLFDDTY